MGRGELIQLLSNKEVELWKDHTMNLKMFGDNDIQTRVSRARWAVIVDILTEIEDKENKER